MSKKYVYKFSEGNATMRELLGGKGANLAEMTNIGLPVPQGFTITTEACTQYYEDGRQINDEIMAEVMENVAAMEELNGKKFGDLENPLLVSVRSGARASMPGMMDTILNLGLNDDVVAAMIKGNPDPKFERFVYDSYRRFIQMFSDVVMEVGKKYFEQLIDAMKEKKGVHYDVELTAADLKELAEQFKAEYKKQLGEDFPSDPVVQLKEAIRAVFRSWDNPRANVYRRDNDIPYSWGTAVNVMPMVFGNLNENSGTGVAFTRDPATGAKGLYGEFLTNAQGEDVVAGVRTPMPITEMEQKFPEAFKQFVDVCSILEHHYHDMQDMEFTVENGKLYMLQCRNGKRTPQAALKIACDLVDEGMIDEKQAVLMIEPRTLDALLHPQFDSAALKAATPIGKGLGASPGAACGKVVFSAEDAKEWASRKEKVVLVRLETSPEDIEGMKAAQGILTVRGGRTSHAAVVARGMGKCCVSGCGEIKMDEENKKFTLAGKTFHEGDFISIDGSTGNIYDGVIPTVDATIAGEFGRIMAWADKYRRLQVRTNADTPADARKARELGAQGIGLTRTEHMFFNEDRIAPFREMICADTVEERVAALAKLEPMQQSDFEGIYEAMEGNPVTIRFLDPPLHEFVPTEEADIAALAEGCPAAGVLEPGDRILSIDGHRVAVYFDVSGALSAGGDEKTFVVKRDGQKLTLADVPLPLKEYTENGQTVKRYGLTFTREEATPLGVLAQGAGTCDYFARAVWQGLSMLVRGQVGLTDMSGPVGIVSYMSEAGSQGPTVLGGIQNVLYIVALIAVNLAIMNMLPIPGLDGGRFFLLIAGELFYRITQRRLDPKYEAYLNAAFLVLLMAFMAVVTFSDVWKLVK